MIVGRHEQHLLRGIGQPDRGDLLRRPQRPPACDRRSRRRSRCDGRVDRRRRAARTGGRVPPARRRRVGSGMSILPGTIAVSGVQRRKVSAVPRRPVTGRPTTRPAACSAAQSRWVGSSSLMDQNTETARAPWPAASSGPSLASRAANAAATMGSMVARIASDVARILVLSGVRVIQNSVRGHSDRGTSTPGTYNVGGRRVPKSTDEGRDSSLEIDKAPGIQIQHVSRSSPMRCRAFSGCPPGDRAGGVPETREARRSGASAAVADWDQTCRKLARLTVTVSWPA